MTPDYVAPIFVWSVVCFKEIQSHEKILNFFQKFPLAQLPACPLCTDLIPFLSGIIFLA
jgi:hypothetical protein